MKNKKLYISNTVNAYDTGALHCNFATRNDMCVVVTDNFHILNLFYNYTIDLYRGLFTVFKNHITGSFLINDIYRT